MALDKAIQHGKEHRKPYTRGKAIDRTCRNHGHASNVQEEIADAKLAEYEKGGSG